MQKERVKKWTGEQETGNQSRTMINGLGFIVEIKVQKERVEKHIKKSEKIMGKRIMK